MGGRDIAGDVFAGVVAGLGHLLHLEGVPVTPERSLRFARAVSVAQPSTVDEAYWLGRATLLTAREQVEVYDRVFDEVFRGLITLSDAGGSTPPTAAGDPGPGADDEDNARAQGRDATSTQQGGLTQSSPGESPSDLEDADDPQALAAVSVSERLATRDFAACSEDELALIRRLVDELPLVPPPRQGRRHRRDRRGRRLDVRATLRAAHRTGGDPVRLVTRRQVERPRRVVLIADVSGSMEPYARVYLHLMRGAVQALHAEAFVFATRLTRLTHALAAANADVAYGRAMDAAPDWSGGTRIGRALRTFLDEHGRRGMARGAVLVIVSDGWEVESPELVGESMQRLARLAHHVIWVNPRKAAASYQPLAGGMAAGLPHVDTFVSGHSVRALEEVLAAIRGATARRAAPIPARVPA